MIAKAASDDLTSLTSWSLPQTNSLQHKFPNPERYTAMSNLLERGRSSNPASSDTLDDILLSPSSSRPCLLLTQATRPLVIIK